MAFMLRALLPAGYMADAQQWRHGTLTVALCLADGSIRRGEPPPHDDPQDATHILCPAGAVKLLALTDPVLPVPTLTAVSFLAVLTWRAHADGPADLAGPPLGSRAPPAPALPPTA